MAANVRSDGETVTVTTADGHRIRFAMTELNAESTAGDISTEWSGGTAPDDPEQVVRSAKAEAEAHVARHAPAGPDEARAAREENRGIGGSIRQALGLP